MQSCEETGCRADDAIRASRESLLKPGSDVFVRVYGQDGRELFPEPRVVRVPADFGVTGRVPLNLRVKQFVRWVAVWREREAGAGVPIQDAWRTPGHVGSALMFEGIDARDGVPCSIDALSFTLSA
jgi:hypothetical protein